MAPTSIDPEVIAGIPVFSGLSSNALTILLKDAAILNLRPGRALFRQGEPAHTFSIILDGWIKLYRNTPAGDETVLNVCTTGPMLYRGDCLHIRVLSCDGLRRLAGEGHGDSRRSCLAMHSRDAGRCDCADCVHFAACEPHGSAT